MGWITRGATRRARTAFGLVAGILVGFAAVTVPAAAAAAAPVAPVAPVGQGFTVTPTDLAVILQQIKIAEAHVRNTTAATGPCGALLGTGADQIANPVVPFGLRSVDGSCNHLEAGRAGYGSSDQVFPRLTARELRDADPSPADPSQRTSYRSIGSGDGTTNVVDSEPRLISNLIADQTSSNPAAVVAAARPRRTQGDLGVVACDASGAPAGCVPGGKTLSIPNVSTDVGLSPPFNGLFTLFGQFFDHGLDFTSKTNDAVLVPLRSDDPLWNSTPPSRRFMVLSRTKNQPGPDGRLGTADDVQDGINRDTPFVDQSQTYSSHPSHQVFLREYALVNGTPRATGKLLGSPDGGMATWALVKQQAAFRLGLKLTDTDVFNIPMIAADPYGDLIPGPRGFAQYVLTDGTLVEGDPGAGGGTGVPVPANVRRIDTALLDDIANSATPTSGLVPDADTTIGDDRDRTTYDDELLDAHYVTGDGRTNENIGLTAIHQVFHSEHDRLVDDIQATLDRPENAALAAAFRATSEANPGRPVTFGYGERLFQAARFVAEMEYQHLVFEEFARKVQPALPAFSSYHADINPAITAEFAHAVYRFGHSMLTDTIDRINADGSRNDLPLLDGFLNPPKYTDGGSAGPLTPQQAAGSLIMGMSDQAGQEIDEFVTETLRDNLLGLPLDLATLNITRARDAGIPRLNGVRRQLHATTGDSSLAPYGSWTEFGMALKHPESLVNFVAAYGAHPTITAQSTIAGRRAAAPLLVDPPLDADPATIPADAADFMNSTGTWANGADDRTTTGLDAVDLWIGGLAESTNLFGGLLGSTFGYVFEQQLLNLQNGDRFYYLSRTVGMNLRQQLEGNSFAELVQRNTTANTLKADAFGTANCKFQLAAVTSPAPAGSAITGTGSVADDPATACNENLLLIKLGDATIAYRATNLVDPPGINGQSVYNGTAGADKVRGGLDNDTFWGNEGNDRIEGNDGADTALGGAGDDIITDSAGDDTLKGGPGHDVIDGGPGLDLVLGGDGDDALNGGAGDNVTFGGGGDDKIIAGVGSDLAFGDAGADWIEGGAGADELNGETASEFLELDAAGPDVLIGQSGDDVYNGEGGDDVLMSGPGIEKNVGRGGFDWSSGQLDDKTLDADLNLVVGALPLTVAELRDRYAGVEGLSGTGGDDILRGDSLIPKDNVRGGLPTQDWLTKAGLDLIPGLAAIVPPLTRRPAGPETEPIWGDGNILLGGAGSDLLEGRGGDDVLDGDRSLHVYLSVLSPTDHTTEIGRADLLENPYLAGSTRTLQQDLLAGRVNPHDVVIRREVVSAPATSGDIDTAIYSGPQSAYDVTDNGDGSFTVTDQVARNGGGAGGGGGGGGAVGGGGAAGGGGLGGGATARISDGKDLLRNVECLQFADRKVALTPGCNHPPQGTVTLSTANPVEGQTVTATDDITDPDVVDPFTMQYSWQAQIAGDWVPLAAGVTEFTPDNAAVGAPLRVVATYTDGLGSQEQVTSAVTAAVQNVNDAPTGQPALSTLAPSEGIALTATVGTLDDLDGLPPTARLRWQWQSAATAAGPFTDLAGATATDWTPTAAQARQVLRVRVDYTDLHGTAESVTSAVTSPVTPAITAPAAPSGVTVTPGLHSATVSWTAPNDGGSQIISSTVDAVNALGTVVATVSVAGTGTGVTLTGLVDGVYRFRVAATNAAGTGPASALSAPVTLVTPVAPSAPVVTGTGRGVASVSVTWTPPASDGGSPVTGYIVRAFTASGAAAAPDVRVAGSARMATVAGLAVGTYTLKVRASNRFGDSPFSAASAPVAPAAVPGTPAAPQATPSPGAVTVTWAPPADTGGLPITGYTLQTLNANGNVVATRTLTGDVNSARVTGPNLGERYRWRVRATNQLGTGPLSAASAPVLLADVPGAPAAANPDRGAPGGPLTFTAVWNPPTSSGGSPITGYRVYALRMSDATASATVVSESASPVVAATSRSVTFTVTTPAGTNYRFQVEAINAVGTGPRSARSANVVPR